MIMGAKGLASSKVFSVFVILLLLIVFMVVADGGEFDGPTIINGTSFIFGMPFAANGQQAGVASSSPYYAGNIGAAFASINGSKVGFRIFFEGNVTNTTLCNSDTNLSFYLYVDADRSPASGCNIFDPVQCFPGANARIFINGSNVGGGSGIQNWNGAIFETNVSATDSWDWNATVLCNQRMLLMAAPKAGLGLTDSNGPLTLVGKVTTQITGNDTPQGIIDELLPGGHFGTGGGSGGGCRQYNNNQNGCVNSSVMSGLSCTWKSSFNACEDNFNSVQDCDHFADKCESSGTCTVGTQYRPPAVWDSVRNKCYIPFISGGFASQCINQCGGCFDQINCEQKGLGSAGNCQWKTVDPATERKECRSANEKICSTDYPTLCPNPGACDSLDGEGDYDWSSQLNVCLPAEMTNGSIEYGTMDFKEVCFNGEDDNGDSNIDCADESCFNVSAGADAWKTADPSCGGGYNPTQFGHTIGEGFDRNAFNRDRLFKGGSQSSPVQIGNDLIDDQIDVPNSTDLDIVGLGVKDMDTSFGFGIMTRTGNYIASCAPFNLGGNMTEQFYYLFDSDNNESTGCQLAYTFMDNLTFNNFNGTDYAFQYKVTSTGEELRRGYRCTNVHGIYKLVPFSASLAGVPNEMKARVCNNQVSAQILIIPKDSLGKTSVESLKVPMKVSVFTGNDSSFQSDISDGLDNVVDVLLNSYYTPGSAEAKPIDCRANPSACGSSYAENGHFSGENCFNEADDNSNGLVDCADPMCIYVPNCADSDDLYDPTTDRVAPTIISTTANAFESGAFLTVATDKPTNLTLTFYATNSSCQGTSEILYDLGNPNFDGDNYRSFHPMPLFNGVMLQGNGSTVELSIEAETTYYYMMELFAQSGMKATSSCLNFTTSGVGSSNVIFRPLFTPISGDLHLSSLRFKVTNANGVVLSDVSAIANTPTEEIGVITNVTIGLHGTDGTGVSLLGANLAQDNLELNFTDAFNISSNDTYGFVGMDNDLWAEILQNLGVTQIEITVPGTGDNLFHCDEDGVSNCVDITNEDGVEFISEDSIVSTTTWSVPISIGFSSYAITTPASGDDAPGGGGGGGSGGSATIVSNAVAQTEAVATLTKLGIGSQAKFTFALDTVGVSEVNFKVKKELTNAKVSILLTNEANVGKVLNSDKVYQYLKIDKTNFENSDIDGTAKVKFKVTKKWLTENNLDKSDIRLFRLDNNEWAELMTSVTSDDATSVSFTAETPGFSYFAIGNKFAVVPVVVQQTSETNETTTPEKSTGSNIWVWVLILVIIIVIAIILVKRNSSSKRLKW